MDLLLNEYWHEHRVLFFFLQQTRNWTLKKDTNKDIIYVVALDEFRKHNYLKALEIRYQPVYNGNFTEFAIKIFNLLPRSYVCWKSSNLIYFLHYVNKVNACAY